jgi:hypothetical protein
MALAPTYFTIAEVKPWLRGKVTFGIDPVTSIDDAFLNVLCAQAESVVILDLNQFYEVPLVSKTTNTYEGLPGTTRAFLNRLFILQSVKLILSEDFGQKSSVISSDYADQMHKEYAKTLSRMSYKDPRTGQYSLAPLPDLRINVKNWTGLKVVPNPQVTSGPCGLANNMNYAITQITTPALSWWDFGGGCSGCGNTNCSGC